MKCGIKEKSHGCAALFIQCMHRNGIPNCFAMKFIWRATSGKLHCLYGPHMSVPHIWTENEFRQSWTQALCYRPPTVWHLFCSTPSRYAGIVIRWKYHFVLIEFVTKGILWTRAAYAKLHNHLIARNLIGELFPSGSIQQRNSIWWNRPLGPILLTWINFNPSMDK